MTISEQSLGPSVGKIPAPAFDQIPATPESEIDQVLGKLKSKTREFAQASIRQKIGWLQDVLTRSVDVAPESVAAQCRAKGISMDSPLAGEEWLGGPGVTIRNIRLLIESLEDIEQNGTPRYQKSGVRERAEGGVAIRVTPHDKFDGALYGGITCETWLQKPIGPGDITDNQASFYKKQDPEGGVSLVLGAGNVASIPPMDVLYKMFVDGMVCVLKMNPVNEYLGPFIERAFKPLVDAGYLAVVYGGGDVGAYLCQHNHVDDIHITGSDKTHDLIVWGPPGEDRDRRKKENDPLLKKPITSELGNVSPVMVVPGPYTDDEMDSMAHNIAGMVTNNASFNCNAAKMLVLPKGWDKNEELIRRISDALRKVPTRKAYYPGAASRYAFLTEGHQGLIQIGEASDGQLPWTMIPGLDSADASDRRFHNEPFCAIISQTEIGSSDPAEYLKEATKFANDVLWGTLSAMMFIHPKTEKDPASKPAFDAALRDLRYGTIGINLWAAFVYALGTAPWGGHPSATLDNIQSGLGWVHNTPMFENIEKAIVHGPIKPFPKLPTFAGHKTAHIMGRKVVAFEAKPSWLKVPGLAMAAMKG